MTADDDAATSRKRERIRRFHRENIDRLAETTKKHKEHNDEVEARDRMRKRGSLPPPKGSGT